MATYGGIIYLTYVLRVLGFTRSKVVVRSEWGSVGVIRSMVTGWTVLFVIANRVIWSWIMKGPTNMKDTNFDFVGPAAGLKTITG